MATQTSTATLAELKTRVRQRADMVNDDFVEDAELVTYIQQSYRKLYNLIVTTFSDWYVDDPVEFTLASGENTYTLPATFYKLVAVDFKLNGKWVEVLRFNMNERNRTTAGRFRIYHPINRYRLMNNKLRFIPSDNAEGDYRYWAVSKPSVPVDDSDTIEGENGWDEFVVLDAAIKCLNKEETDPSILIMEQQQIKEDILINANSYDEGGSERVEDVNAPYLDTEDLF